MLPFVKVSGSSIPMYGLFIAVGIFAAVLYLYSECIRKGLKWNKALVIGTAAVCSGFIGAKLLFVAVTYTPGEVIDFIRNGKTADLMESGFVFYGGLVFGILGAYVGAAIAGCKIKDYENALIKTVPLAHGFGRIGCLMAGCCYGKPTNSALSIKFNPVVPVTDVPVNVPLIPVQIYESVFNFILFIALLIIDRKYPKQRILLPLYLPAYSVERFIMEYFRYDSIRGIFCGLSTSQWISMVLFIFGLVLLVTRMREANGATN